MTAKSDFMAAEEIKAVLHGRDKGEQERILRWVSESIGIAANTLHVASVPPPAGTAATMVTPSSVASAADATVRRKDIKTFVIEKSPKSDVQFAAVTAYFFAFEASPAERKEVIVAQDLQEAGRQARGYGFKYAQQTLANGVTLGYFDRAGRGEFKLNAVGENLVAMALPGAGSTVTKAAKSKKKTTRASSKSKSKRKPTKAG
ncbi:MAG: hypothetical protein ABMA01_13300 [Chthoniobacteraceae bacterium]